MSDAVFVDTNKQVAWRVIERKTGKVIAEFPHMLRALAKCEELEPHPETSGFRYTMEFVRSVDVRGVLGMVRRKCQLCGHSPNGCQNPKCPFSPKDRGADNQGPSW